VKLRPEAPSPLLSDMRLCCGDGEKDKILTLHGYEDVVFSVLFSLDGRRIVSSSRDGTVRVWKLANQK